MLRLSNLTVLIPTIVGREHLFDALIDSLPKVNVVFARDNKELSIGMKRQQLIDNCETEYCVMLDDDDLLAPYYFKEVAKALKQKPDCICYLESVNETQVAIHSNRFATWGSGGGYDFFRTPFCKDVIKTEIVRKIGFRDMRYGEDKDFADRLKASGLIKTEVFIDKVMYHYRMPQPMSAQQHRTRYGIN